MGQIGINIFLRPIALLLITTFLLQSCKVFYKSAPLEQVLEDNYKDMLLITIYEEKYHYIKIELHNDTLYCYDGDESVQIQ